MPSEEGKRKNQKKENKKNLGDELGNFLLESLHHIGQSLNLVSFMEIKNALSANRLLVSVAVGVGLQVRMLLTVHH